MSLAAYEKHIPKLRCHNPCETHRCDKKSRCVFNENSNVGYDCVCNEGFTADEFTEKPGKAGYGNNNGCVKSQEKPTEKPTKKPTEKPAEKPTTKPTEKPTEKPTQKPTVKPSIAPDEKPNVILLMTDDFGVGDFTINNPESKVPTPNIDRIGREGVNFFDGHSSSSRCGPSRWMMLTGRYFIYLLFMEYLLIKSPF